MTPRPSAARSRRSGVGVCAAGLLALACQRVGAPPSPDGGLTRDPLRLVAWNVQKCEGGIDNVVAALARLDADVICLQEVVEPRGAAEVENQTRTLADALGMHAYSSGGPLDDDRQQCLAILCRAPLSDASPLAISADRNYRVTVVTRWRGVPLRIVCVHLAGTYKAEIGHVIRTSRERAQDWDALLSAAKQWSEPLLLAGDFNSVGAAPEFAAMGSILHRLTATGASFPSAAPWLDLDHIVHSAALRPVRVENVASRVADHRPLLAEFTRASE